MLHPLVREAKAARDVRLAIHNMRAAVERGAVFDMLGELAVILDAGGVRAIAEGSDPYVGPPPIADVLEPMSGVFNRDTPEVSIAISLKRIADALDPRSRLSSDAADDARRTLMEGLRKPPG